MAERDRLTSLRGGQLSLQQVAAIVAAVEACWPRPVVLAPPVPTTPPTVWRWSSRWWLPRPPVAAARRRP